MTFIVAADGYDRFIGRYSRQLAPLFLDFTEIESGPVLDVGSGPGGLTSVLAERFGASSVAAVDPSEPFVAACLKRVPGADVRLASGEKLPFEDDRFQGALSQLVLAFVRDAERVAGEMRRVVKPGGTVATCMFEANGFTLVRTFWDAALDLDPAAPDDAKLPFRRMEELVILFERAGLNQLETRTLRVEAEYDDFDDLWLPFAFGIGPAASYLNKQTEDRREALRGAVFDKLGRPQGPFSLPAEVLAIRGLV